MGPSVTIRRMQTVDVTVPVRSPATGSNSESMASLFLRFLRFGLLAWGGPVAQIGMLREELVERERWIDPVRFNRVLGVYQALPGPEAHELCVYFGYVRRGRLGGLLAGLGFMLPGFALIMAVSWIYVTWGLRSAVAVGLFAGFGPVVAALVVRAVKRISGHAMHDRWSWAIAAASVVATLAGAWFATPLLAGALCYWAAQRGSRVLAVVALVGLAVVTTLTFDAASMPISAATLRSDAERLELFAGHGVEGARGERREAGNAPLTDVAAAGLRGGLLTFGGAYTVIPFLEHDAVQEGDWLTSDEFVDGLAIGGVLPAPLIIFSTFVAYLGGGASAALVMTVIIFLPAFAFTLIGHRAVERAVTDTRLHAILDGVTAAVVGLIVVAALGIMRTAISDLVGLLVFIAALLVLARWKARSAMVTVMLAGGLLGIVQAVVG